MPTNTAEITPKIEPLMLRAKAAAELCSISPRHWAMLAASGKLPPSIKLGKARLWRLDILRKWIAWDCPTIDRFKQLLEAEKR